MCTHRRKTEKEANICEDLEFLAARIPEAKLATLKENAKVFDYVMLFALPTADELRERHNLGGPVGGSVSSRAGSKVEVADDEIPW